MQIVLLRDLMIPTKDGRCEMHKAGERLSVYHVTGRNAIHRRFAKWICGETGDPPGPDGHFWTPIAQFRAAIPQHDKMIRTAANK